MDTSRGIDEAVSKAFYGLTIPLSLMGEGDKNRRY
jgi:hypothetical protein